MLTGGLKVVALVTLVACLGSVRGRVVNFDISKLDPPTTLKVAYDDEISCSFSYSLESGTGQSPAQPAPAVVGSKTDAEVVAEIVGRGGCHSLSDDYFEYKVCLAGDITQSNMRTHNLCGKFSQLSSNGLSVLYGGGTLCDVGEMKPRTSRVDFVCDTATRLVAVAEVSTCAYVFTVGSPDVCGRPAFASANAVLSQKGTSASSLPQRWLLEVSRLLDGTFQCTARHAGMAGASDIKFTYFAMEGFGFESASVLHVTGPAFALVSPDLFLVTHTKVESVPSFTGDLTALVVTYE